jgi:polysaccharide pyruvyl transferase WcaK-like protein
MTVEQFLNETNLEDCLLMGYYGGGNFGDELLLEVLLARLRARKVRRLSFMYMNPSRYSQFHHDHGYRMVSGRRAILGSALRAKHIVVGGGGLWGLDTNLSVFALSLLLFALRLVGKRIHLIGVGYYGSAKRLGRMSAWLAGKSARTLIARDAETRLNFETINPAVVEDEDIAWQVPNLDLTPYAAEADALESGLTIHPQMVYVTLRAHTGRQYRSQIEAIVRDNPSTHFLLGLLWPGGPAADEQYIQGLTSRYANAQFLDGHCNPLALTLFFQRHAQKLRFITPQYHAILVAGLYGIPVAPIAYDNKVRQLLNQQEITNVIELDELVTSDLQAFLDSSGRRS